MKIAVVLGYQPPCYGGGFTYQESIVNELLQYNGKHTFYIFYHKEHPLGDSVTGCNQAIEFILVDENLASENGLSTTSTLLLRYQIDLCWFLSSPFQLVHTPFICTVWDLEHRKQPFFPEVSQTGWTWEAREANFRQYLPKAAYVITGTEAGQQEIQTYYQVPKERIKVIPFTIPGWLTEFANQQLDAPMINSDEAYLFYPAQFWPHKNHIVLLHALKMLRDKFSLHFSLVFTGSDMGNLQHIREEAERLGLKNQVIFLGFVERKMMASLYKHAFALVYPSFFGPDNLPPLEAFGLGCPVLAATQFESHQHLEDAVLLFDPKNEEALAHHIHTLTLNPNQRNQLIENGLAFYRKNSTTKFINGIDTLLNEFESYRRTWSTHMLYRHFIPQCHESENNVQYTIDDIYSMNIRLKAETGRLGVETQRLEAETQRLEAEKQRLEAEKQHLSQLCDAQKKEIQDLLFVIRRTTLIGILRSVWHRVKKKIRPKACVT